MVRDFGFQHLSTGDLLREEQKHNGINAELIQDYITAGKLVPSEILVRLVQKAIRDKGSQGVFLLDGFPRSF
jgi:adenylate kinase family enzyme